MDFQFNAEQQELREVARQFLAEASDSEAVRRAMQSELGYEPALWKQIGAELGWSAVQVPEACGGLGLSHVELVALMEVMGEALLCAPFFSSVVLGTNAILAAASETQQSEWLPDLAEGTRTATLAVCGRDGRWEPDGVAVSWRPDGDGFALEGDAWHVPDGHSADQLVVAARHPEAGIALFALAADTPGLTRQRLATLDQTRRLAHVRLAGVRVPATARLGHAEREPGGDAARLAHVLDLACVALAGEQVGGAQKSLDLAVAYAGERVQFGRPIGGFQAIKHKCADLMVAIESARSGVYYAACAAAEESEELPVVASLAKAVASEACFRAAAECLQIHGGVGFTWEYDVHLHLKRARAGEALLGSPAWHRERIARAIGLDEPGASPA